MSVEAFLLDMSIQAELVKSYTFHPLVEVIGPPTWHRRDLFQQASWTFDNIPQRAIFDLYHTYFLIAQMFDEYSLDHERILDELEMLHYALVPELRLV